MRVTKLEVENVKRIKAITISPTEGAVIIGGRNGQGKTSALDAMMYAIAGGKSLPDKPLREGATEGKVVVDIGDFIVTRTFEPNGPGKIIVTNREGLRASSPQALLNGLYNELSFDPLTFARMEPKKRIATLLAILKIDPEQWESRRKALYDHRTQVNRDIKQAEGVLSTLPHHPDAPAEEVSLTALADEMERAQAHNRKVQSLADEADVAQGRVLKIEETIADLEARIRSLTRQVGEAKVVLQSAQANAKEAADLAGAAQVQDTAEIRQKMASAELVNQHVRENAARAKCQARLTALRAEADADSQQISAIDAEKAKAISEASLPVEGLAFNDSDVLLNGLPFGQASSAEQLRASIAMGMALNPKLRILRIQDGSLLDADSLEMIRAMATENDYQFWIERVGDGPECSVIIEDGMVAQVAAEADGKEAGDGAVPG